MLLQKHDTLSEINQINLISGSDNLREIMSSRRAGFDSKRKFYSIKILSRRGGLLVHLIIF